MRDVSSKRRFAALTLISLAAFSALAGCAKKPEKEYFSNSFVPAGMDKMGIGGVRTANAGGYAANRDPRGMAGGDPNVSAAVRAHVIRGLPVGPQNTPVTGGQPHP